MSRSGYRDDLDPRDLAMWRGRVASAIRGKRGQALLKDIAEFMDTMPEKILVSGALKTSDGEVCALGCGLEYRHIENPEEAPEDYGYMDTEWIAEQLNIAECLALEIVYINDEAGNYKETTAQRWRRVREWLNKHIKPTEERQQP